MDNAYYTVHHNWEWIIDKVLKEIQYELNIIKCKKSSQLPSHQNKKVKPSYSIFRMETISSRLWLSSEAFSQLDSKDFLYDSLSKRGCGELMPSTMLLNWDEVNEESMPPFYDKPTPSCKLLKAACGAGGFGIYKVFSRSDVISILRFHSKQALSQDGFHDKLKQDHEGKVPQWSLQEYMDSVRVFDDRRKCQFRVYVCYCDGEVYVYNTIEVRTPIWSNNITCNSDVNSSITQESVAVTAVQQFENDCCENTTAIPYNFNREKALTERFLLEEIEDISSSYSDIKACVVTAMTHLKPTIISDATRDTLIPPPVTSTTEPNNITRIALAGVDLVLTEITLSDNQKKLIPKIVEMNNYPAMPSIDKKMSVKYRGHLEKLVKSLLFFNTIRFDMCSFDKI
jgi:hypothetical protein